MTSTIHDGDVVIYSPGLIRDNGIYIIDVFEYMKCKRIEFRVDGSYVILSANPRYENETVKPENQSVRVCGKVIGWFHLHRY
jgi:phage repressor protein C with HTH and peptisase S24 domain